MNKTWKGIILAAACLGLAFCASSQSSVEKKQKNDPRYQYNMGLLYLNNPTGGAASLDQAVYYFDRAITLNPKYYLAWNARGLTMIMKGDLDSGVKSFRKCLEINATFSEAHNNLGSVFESEGLTTLAEEEYKKALADEAYTNKELPLYNLARMSFTMGKNDDALSYIQKAIQISGRFAMAHNLKGMIFEKMGLRSDAIASFEQAVKIVPEDMNFQFNLASAYFNSGDMERAGGILTMILGKTTDPDLRSKVAELKKKIK